MAGLVTGSTTELVQAGGGPDNVLLVVNQRSWASHTIANYYRALRQLPDDHVVYLDWSKRVTGTDIESFRREILGPVIEAMRAKGLSKQIDYVIYSADFPYSINYKKDIDAEEPRPFASLTGLTYYAPQVMSRKIGYLELDSNWYMQPWQMRPGERPTPIPESRGFRASIGWLERGGMTLHGGQHYFLSTMLAYTSGRGNSISEAIDYLQQSAAADGTFPRGTIYFAQTNNIRSQARHFSFPLVVDKLKRVGVHAEILNTIVPTRRNDVAGLVMGMNNFNWPAAQNQVVPGAICDNFTSYGGILKENSPQVPLTSFLRSGAAGASGTVVEPMSILSKFPHPMMHLHYVHGCSLAESFYQSVHGPYQLLIVGDPLCQPWAHTPDLKLDGLKANATLQGTIRIIPSAKTTDSEQIHHFEFFFDGRRVAVHRPGEALVFDTRAVDD